MLRGENEVQFCIDAIAATSLLSKYIDIQIQVDIEHCLLKYSNNIFFEKGNSEKTLDISKNLYINKVNPDYSAIVSIYVEEMKIYEKIYNVPKYKLSDFEVVETLGNGSSGVAYKVTDDQGQPHVLKVPNTKIDINNPRSNGMREIILLIALPRHPCMIRLDGFICDHNHGIILVLEYASRGQIDKIDFKSLEESRAFKILYGLFSCVAFIHAHGFIHHDLHYKNILVTEDYEARLIDFDVSRFYGDDMTHNVGHQGYMAPEMMGNGYYNEMVDEFSLGVLISDIFDKSSPFYLLNFLLKNDDAQRRFRCSEICTLLECECLIDISSEAESYITELSRYHESEALNDDSIFMMIFYINFVNNKNAFCNILKLFDCIDVQETRYLYSTFILFDENFALDTDYIYNNGEHIPVKIMLRSKISINLSIDKIIYAYYSLLRRHDIKDVSAFFFTIFWSYDWSINLLKSIPIDALNLIFEWIIGNLDNSDKIFIFLESLYRKACKFDAAYLIYQFSLAALKKYQITNSIVLKSFEYLVEIGDSTIDLCEILANVYINLDPHDYVKAKYYAKKGFKKGNFKCASCLARVYFHKNKMEKAMKYLKISAKHGAADAMCFLGSAYIIGDYLQQNIEKGIKYLKKSANKGFRDAQDALASFNFRGFLIPRNFPQAFWYNILALKQGCKGALSIQALFYFYGIVVEQDFVKARILLEQSIDTVNRHNVILMLSTIHLYGLGVEINIEKANYYLGLLVQEGVQRNDYPITVDEAYIRSIREEVIHNILNLPCPII